MRPESRADAQDPDLVEQLGKVSAIFMTGGNQLKLSSFITGTPFGDAIHEAYERGAVVGGTSAGASILAEHMIAFGSGGSTPKQRMSQLSVGFGLIKGVVIDQHFEQRNRYGRLMSLVAQSPSLLGMGIDEDTAAVIREGNRVEVVGRGAVTIVDGRQLISNAFAARRTAPLLMSNAIVHVLPAGAQFDLESRSLIAHQTPVPDHEVLDARAAEADLRKLAGDIAAEGVSRPITLGTSGGADDRCRCSVRPLADPDRGSRGVRRVRRGLLRPGDRQRRRDEAGRSGRPGPHPAGRLGRI